MPFKAKRANGGVPLVILNLRARRRSVIKPRPRCLASGKETHYPTVEKAGWVQVRSGRVRKVSRSSGFES